MRCRPTPATGPTRRSPAFAKPAISSGTPSRNRRRPTRLHGPRAKAQLEPEWNAFEADVRKYVESFGKQVEQQQATFKLQAEAQLKAWREAADKLGSDAKQFATGRQAEIDVAVKRMQVDAGAAEEKLQKQLDQMGTQSWSALMTVLTETRAAFDRANQAARDAFKRSA